MLIVQDQGDFGFVEQPEHNIIYERDISQFVNIIKHLSNTSDFFFHIFGDFFGLFFGDLVITTREEYFEIDDPIGIEHVVEKRQQISREFVHEISNK
jgi:hypothetical protein